MINGHKCHALLDSGSQVTIVAWRDFLKMNPRPRLTPIDHQLRTADGTPLHVRGEALLTFSLGSKVISRSAVIVEGLGNQAILGHDFLEEEGVVIDAGRRRVTVATAKPLILHANKTYTLHPRSEQLVHAVCGTGHLSAGADYVLDPIDLSGGGSAAPCLIRAATAVCAVLISNASDQPVLIGKGTPLATASPLPHWQSRSNPSFSVNEVAAMGIDRDVKKNQWLITAEMVNLSQLPPELRGQYLRLLNDYSDVFSRHPLDLGRASVVKQRIILKDPGQVACAPPHRVPHHLKEVVLKYVDALLEAGVIRKSTSPFSSPLMLVRKAGADPNDPDITKVYRVVHDFRILNGMTVSDAYPLHHVHQLLDSVANSKVWSLIDLSAGFFQQELTEESCAFTAFGVAGRGAYEYSVSSQGLKNSSAAFQRLLDYVVRSIENCYVYIDDLVLCDQDYVQHLVSLAKVFDRLREYHLKCSLGKLQLGCTEINYLGFNISRANGIRAGAAKTEAVRRWASPTTVTEVKQFLGLCSFFRRTIENFASIASPLTRLTRKDSTWLSGRLPADAEAAFVKLRSLLCSRPCLTPVDFTRDVIVTVDTASAHGMGAILSQMGADGIERPCAYISKVLTEKEKGDSAFMAEAKGCLWACRTLKCYLSGRSFVLRCDHRPLLSLNNTQKLVMSRVYAEMEEFLPYTVEYIKGELMPADGLSRYRRLPSQVAAVTMTEEQVFHLQKQDSQSKALFCYCKFGLRPKNEALLKLVEKLGPSATIPQGLLRITDKSGCVRTFAPSNLRLTLIQLAHDSPTSGHYSALKTYNRLRQDWYWPSCRQETFAYCSACHVCATVNSPAHRRPVPLRPLPFPGRFNERLAVDLLGPLPTCPSTGAKYLMVLNDAYSKLVQLVPLPDKSADTVVTGILDNWVKEHSVCQTLLSDLGREFQNRLMAKLCERLNISHDTSSVAHARSNGLAENHNKSVVAYMRKFLAGGNDWVAQLPSLQLAYNSAPHSSTGYSPYFLAFNRHPVMPYSMTLSPTSPDYAPDTLSQQLVRMQSTQARVRVLLEEAFDSQKAQFDKRARPPRCFRIGERVYLDRAKSGQQFQKFQPKFRGPFLVVATAPHDHYVVVDEATGRRLPALHVEHLKAVPYLRQFSSDSRTDLPDPVVAQPGLADLGDAFPAPPPWRPRRRRRLPFAPAPDVDDEEGDLPLPAPAPAPAAALSPPGSPPDSPPGSPASSTSPPRPASPADSHGSGSSSDFHGWVSQSDDEDPPMPPPPLPGPPRGRATAVRGRAVRGRGAPVARGGPAPRGPVSLAGTAARVSARLRGLLPPDLPLIDRKPRRDRGRGRGGDGGSAV